MMIDLEMRGAVLTALRSDPALKARLNGVYDGDPARAAAPYAVVGTMTGADWGTKDRAGRELTLAVTLYDKGEDPGRIGALAGAAEAVLAGMHGAASIAASRVVRTRVVRPREGEWAVLMTVRLRVWAA